MRVFLALVVLVTAAAAQSSQSASCSLASDTQRTNWGNQHSLRDLQRRSIRTLRGTVKAGDGLTVAGVLVEVFPYRKGEPILLHNDEDVDKTRVVACVTDESGRFEFNVPSGRYELRASKKDFDPSSTLVVVDTKRGKRTDLDVHIMVGT